MKTIKTTLALATLTLGTIGFTAQEAKAILLSDLLDGASITTGDKIVDNWQFGFGNLDPTLIDVTAIEDDPLNPGLKYTALDGGLTADDDTVGGFLGFQVSTISGDPLINGISLDVTDFSFSGSGGAFGINTGAGELGGGTIADITAFADNATGESDLNPSSNFAPQSSINSGLIIEIVSDAPGEPTSLTMFEQRFSQVPEPLTMLGAGMAAGFGAFFKRKLDKNEKT